LRGDCEAMALDGRAGQLEFDVLQISVEDAHLPRDVESHGRSFLKPLTNRRKLLVGHAGRWDFNGLFLNALLFLISLGKRDGDCLRCWREPRKGFRDLIL
jgi:hypothetical protein